MPPEETTTKEEEELEHDDGKADGKYMKERVLRSLLCSNKPKNFWMQLGWFGQN